jgi:gamma-tubulin complex component 3
LNFIDYIFDPSQQDNLLNMSIINEIIFNIDVIHKIINKDLVRIIFTKFNFIKNLECVNKFLLLGQGDMMQTLMESLFEELDKPANLIFKHNLQSNLESSIRASNAQYIDQECLQKLNIKLISASVGDNGWDIFCLEYKTNLPLNVIFTSRLLKDYQKLFIVKITKYGKKLELSVNF